MKKLEWFVYHESFNSNRIEKYDIFQFCKIQEDCEYMIKNGVSKDEFAEQLRGNIFYHFRGRAEHEIILTGWPKRDGFHDEKIDIYNQVMMNYPAFVDFVWNSLHEEKNSTRPKKNELQKNTIGGVKQ